MIPIARDPLRALVAYYRRLEADPDNPVAGFGFSAEKAHFAAVLEPDGSLYAFDDVRERSERGKPAPISLLLPDSGGRSGTGMKPFFTWDNTGYCLGRDNKGNPDRAALQFAAFRDRHLEFREELADDEGFAALCRFLKSWEPAKAESLPNWEEAAGLNIVFKLRGREGYVHQSERVREAWLARQARASEQGAQVIGESLLSGEREELARTHTLIGGVVGANTMGAAIVSFNATAFESYGKSQSYNAPVGTHDAFRYTTALNRLLADRSRRFLIGDATVVFWSDRASGRDAEATLRAIFGDDAGQADPAEHAATLSRIRGFLDAARQGRLEDAIQEPDAPFYVLGLSPNVSRLSVRFWMPGTVRQFAERLAEHAAQLEIVGARPDDPPLSIRRMLLETAREPKEISPRLAGEVTRAILGGTPYPRALFDDVLRRVRVEAGITRAKAAILKAYLVRGELTTMESALDRYHPEPAYHCGRMFALLAFAQDQALGNVGAGVVRRNMGVAMATPGIVLGRLIRAAEVGHIPKLSGDVQRYTQDEFKKICAQIEKRIPTTLNPVRQGIFALGFYHEQVELDRIKAQIEGFGFKRLNRSERGEWMASDLETRVANALAGAGIDYLYESRTVLKTGQDRRPDFLIEGGSPREHIYLEVLGYSGDEYNRRWEKKKEAYAEIGISLEGGEQGRLVVFDWRDKWGDKPDSKPVYPSDIEIRDALRPFLPGLAVTKKNPIDQAESQN